MWKDREREKGKEKNWEETLEEGEGMSTEDLPHEELKLFSVSSRDF